MDSLGDTVVGQHEVAKHRCIVGQPTRRGMGGDRAQRLDEVEFAKAHCI